MIIDATKRIHFAKAIVSFFDANGQQFPWRKSHSAYKILVSEILLRKTTRAQVANIYPDLFRKYPRLRDLARARIHELEKLLRPLGIWRARARLLKDLASAIDGQGGKVLADRDRLLRLPGVGPYAANAVLCLGFGFDLPLVDTNVVRVIERVFSFTSKKKRPREDELMWSFAASLLPNGRAKQFNLGLLDLANQICTPRKPKCEKCPVSKICNYYQNLKRAG
jgi:A/G-specific adenine glycosylase